MNKIRLVINNELQKKNKEKFFIKKELQSILNLYAKMVSNGSWKDYSFTSGVREVSFNVYQRASDKPVLRILKNLKPQFNENNILKYRYDKLSSFEGGNEYLYFDNKNIRNTNVNIRGYNLRDIYENYLFSDYPRYNRKYTYNPDINGGFLINASNVEDPNTEADYANIYFSLENI